MSEHLTQRVLLCDAIRQGLRWYFTGTPCVRGHLSKRNVCDRQCRRCIDLKRALRRRIFPAKYREADRERYHACIETKRAQTRASRSRYLEQRREYDRDRYHNNPVRNAHTKAQANDWWKRNRGKKNAMVSARRSWIRQATPPWLSREHRAEIRRVYIEANRLGLHVDHQVPLRGEFVCGLHVPWNLQHLTAEQNRRKRNVHAS